MSPPTPDQIPPAAPPAPQASPGPDWPASTPETSRNRLGQVFDWRVFSILLVMIVTFLVWRAVKAPATSTIAAESPKAIPVAVAKVTRQDLFNQVPIPAEFRPYLEVLLHAKVSGYVEQITVDIGDRVKAGQLLATLDAPDLVAELNNAIATEQRAEADYTNAHSIFTRLANVVKQHPNLVAQQELDTAQTKDSTTAAIISAAKADVEKYKTLVGYTRITAPFNGVITKRFADPGSLIQAGTASDTQTKALVRLSDNYRLRLDFPVSVSYVKDLHVGDSVEVRVESMNAKRFNGKITRTSDKVEEDTRTMIAEVEVPNPNLELVPGMYAEVMLKVERRENVLAIPMEAVPSGEKPTVYVVNERGEMEERPITLGLETAEKREVLSGLKEGELVFLGRRSEVKPGQRVAPSLAKD